MGYKWGYKLKKYMVYFLNDIVLFYLIYFKMSKIEVFLFI